MDNDRGSAVTVLIGTDGSDAAVEAARRGSTLLPNANPFVIVAVGDPAFAVGPALSTVTATEPQVMEELRRQARTEELQADVVVVGSRGLGGFKRALLGSVSTFVVRNAPCRVLVVRNSSQEEAHE